MQPALSLHSSLSWASSWVHRTGRNSVGCTWCTLSTNINHHENSLGGFEAILWGGCPSCCPTVSVSVWNMAKRVKHACGALCHQWQSLRMEGTSGANKQTLTLISCTFQPMVALINHLLTYLQSAYLATATLRWHCITMYVLKAECDIVMFLLFFCRMFASWNCAIPQTWLHTVGNRAFTLQQRECGMVCRWEDVIMNIVVNLNFDCKLICSPYHFLASDKLLF